MKPFRAVFIIVEDNNCPLYELEDTFILTEKSISFPEGKESCLIFVREMTQLLFQLLGEKERNPDYERKYTCSGCTGLIKFQQVEDAGVDTPSDAEPLLSDSEKKLFDRISGYPLLKAVPANYLKKFIGRFKGRIVKKEEVLIKQGEPNLKLFIILTGKFEVFNGDISIAELGEGDICGEMSYYSDNIASLTVKAITDAKVLSISGEDFGELIGQSETVQFYIVRLLTERLKQSREAKAGDFDNCMQGRINEMAPAELLQIFHMHQKTGVLSLELAGQSGRVVFFQGAIVKADYSGKEGQGAVFSILSKKEGTYTFSIGIPDEEKNLPPIGDFMMLLMEGVKRVDED